jgi:glycosyltransferase involved in cell wall biosynthesis
VTTLYARQDRCHELHDCWPGEAVAWTPPHHCFERWALALELARLRPALVHSPDHVAPAALGWRSVVTVHDLAFRLLPKSHTAASRAYYAGLERSVRQAARVICVSEATKHDVLAAVPESTGKVRVVYEAPDPAYTLDGPAHVQARPYFVVVGTIEPRKNVAGIIRALALIPAASRPELRVVGAPGTAFDEVRSLVATLGLERDVVFLGRRPTAEVAALHRGALALVYPSLLEGFGLPIVEAMSCGAPVITSDRSSMAEIAGGAALTADPHDVDALAAAMSRVAADAALRQELRARGRQRVAEFSWERAASQTLAIFEEALRG